MRQWSMMRRRKQLAPDVRTAACQQQVRDAGVATRDLRVSDRVFGICAACALALLTILSGIGAHWLLLIPLALACMMMSVLLVIVPITACYRGWRTHDARRSIAQMSVEE